MDRQGISFTDSTELPLTIVIMSDTENAMAANPYDEIPYSNIPHSDSHPDHLATLRHLFGLSPVPVTRCRVLELGCAGGGNLIPMAFHLPGSEFLGVELSGRQVEIASKTIRDLHLSNVRVRQAEVLEIDRSWGYFDYIVYHAVYSWVPDEV